MPVSPQDFELYSRMTGTPLPSDAMSRMQMAPEVLQFTKMYQKCNTFSQFLQYCLMDSSTSRYISPEKVTILFTYCNNPPYISFFCYNRNIS